MNDITFTPFPNLETENFILRQLIQTDDNEIFLLRSDDSVARYLDRQKAKTIDDARAFIKKINDNILNNESIYWGVTRKDTQKIIGTICLFQISKKESKAEIGFEVIPRDQGRGIMKEVIPAVLDFGFKTMGLKFIEGDVDPQNIRSIKLMERFGFEFYSKHEKTDVYRLCSK
ncbi:MAG: GNAT family N-acetyltransferase [Ignavibacteriales bacterium]|nr:MAG: GNAT family N-acetyltransferase [Ignavibacteriales bacterium]